MSRSAVAAGQADGTTEPVAEMRGGIGASHDLPTGWRCTGCGRVVPAGVPVPMRCPAAVAGDDVDHVLVRTLAARRLDLADGGEAEPFVRYRRLFHAWHVARAIGWGDADYVRLVERIDGAIAAVDGHGFRETPLGAFAGLDAALELTPGQVLVKDETGNVAGSHKARHLMGTVLELEVNQSLARATAGAGDPDGSRPPSAVLRPTRLAISSCGNAALAAAVVARAWGRDLEVFIPADADPAIVARLRALDARVTVAARDPAVPGDPTYRLLAAAIADGAIPFTCQGNENGFAIEGGTTLGDELVSQLAAAGRSLDHLVVQVGGGALAASCMQALREAVAVGTLERMPRVHTVQTRGAWPLARAWDLVALQMLGRPLDDRPSPPRSGAIADELAHRALSHEGAAVLDALPRHRSTWMWPWETTPHSVAHGILDDETYDWYAVVRGMVESGGQPVVVDEPTLATANRLARRTTGIDVDHTGSAGLAGLLDLRRRGEIAPDDTVAVLFTGVRRSPAGAPRPAGDRS
jgi:threonine synthase